MQLQSAPPRLSSTRHSELALESDGTFKLVIPGGLYKDTERPRSQTVEIDCVTKCRGPVGCESGDAGRTRAFNIAL